MGLYLSFNATTVHLWTPAVIVMAEELQGTSHPSLYEALSAKVISQINV